MASAATLDRAQLLAPTVASLLPSWARSLRASGKSPKTVSGYLDGLRCFTDFLRDRSLPQSVMLVTREHVEMFLEQRRSLGAGGSRVPRAQLRADHQAQWIPRASSTRR